MKTTDPKGDLLHYLRGARSAVVWKLEGLSECDIRRPLTPTGTNLLGLVKHLSGVELLYFGVAFERFADEYPVWFGQEMAPNADMWATADESREEVLDTYRRAWAASDETITVLDLSHVGSVPWLPSGAMTLHGLLVHVLAETERHAGHADIVRELIDGVVGRLPGNDQMGPGAVDEVPRSRSSWEEYRDTIERAAAMHDRPDTRLDRPDRSTHRAGQR